MLMCRFEDIPDKEYLVFLYMSETYRVFRDRLIDEKDRERFNIMSHESMELFLTVTLYSVILKPMRRNT